MQGHIDRWNVTSAGAADSISRMADPYQQLLRNMTGLNPWVETRQPESNQTRSGALKTDDECQKVVISGGMIAQGVQHPVFTPFEQLYRKHTPSNAFVATEDRPVTFELGAYTVPASMALLVTEYEFKLFRRTSVGDCVPVEDERASCSVGWNINLEQLQRGQFLYRVLPTAVQSPKQFAQGDGTQAGAVSTLPTIASQLQRPPTSPVVGTGGVPTGFIESIGGDNFQADPTVFNKAQGSLNSVVYGSGVLPQEARRQGSLNMPFTYIVNERSSVQLSAVVYNPLLVPVETFQGRLSGFLVPSSVLTRLLEGIQPCW